ncbi:general substrate transporter [Hortaea werneckii]|nr:general substrate transporter [Hortaea werneckii]
MAGSRALKDITPYFVYLLVTATIGPLLFGYHLAELNAPQEVITCQKKSLSSNALTRLYSSVGFDVSAGSGDGYLPQCIEMDSVQFGLVSSFFTLGGLIGALSGGPATTQYGRLKAMVVSGILAAIGPAFEALANTIGLLITGRFVAGLGAGAATVIVPIYISEIAPPHQKGFFGSFTQVMINVGILITQTLGLFLSRGQFWRIILGVGGAIAAVQVICLVLGGQESPKWLADNGKPSRAKRTLRKLRGHRANIDEEVVGWGLESERDMEDEEETLLANEDRMDESMSGRASHGDRPEVERDEQGQPRSRLGRAEQRVENFTKTIGFLAVLKNSDYRPAVIAVVMIMVGQQLCGINSIVMYGVSLLSDLLAANSAILNVAVAALNLVVTLSAAPLVDKLGRKTCLLLSITGMGINSILLAISIMKSIAPLSVVAVLLFVASFGLGLGPIPFILSSELVGAEAVGATQSWALAANWIATFVVAQFFPLLSDKLGKGQVYFLFAGFALFFGLFTLWWVPETKGKRDADEVWGRGKRSERED